MSLTANVRRAIELKDEELKAARAVIEAAGDIFMAQEMFKDEIEHPVYHPELKRVYDDYLAKYGEQGGKR
jgi:hypothetical protein